MIVCTTFGKSTGGTRAVSIPRYGAFDIGFAKPTIAIAATMTASGTCGTSTQNGTPRPTQAAIPSGRGLTRASRTDVANDPMTLPPPYAANTSPATRGLWW